MNAHAERPLLAGDPVLLLDGDGNSMYGHVIESSTTDPGVYVSVAAGTWRAGNQ